MQITLFSFISALLWSSLLIIVIYLVRRTRFRPHFGVLTMVLLYLFCAARLLLPLEFPHTAIVSDSVVYPRIYSFLTRKPEPVTHLPVGLLLCAIWLFGTVFLLIRYALQCRKAIRAARQARPWDSRTASLLSEIRRQTGPLQPAAQRCRDGGGGAVGLAPGAQHADVAGLQRERGGVRRDVRAALIDDGDDAHRHAALADAKAVRADEFVQRPADRVRQGSNGLDAGCHALEPCLVQREAVEHNVRDFAARSLEIGGVFRQNGRGLRAQLLRHGGKGAVFRRGIAQRRAGRRGLCALQNDLCRGEFHHASTSCARNFVPTGLPSIRS